MRTFALYLQQSLLGFLAIGCTRESPIRSNLASKVGRYYHHKILSMGAPLDFSTQSLRGNHVLNIRKLGYDLS